jgi:hypothetical protein
MEFVMSSPEGLRRAVHGLLARTAVPVRRNIYRIQSLIHEWTAWVDSAVYLLIELPLAAATFWLLYDHDGAIEFLNLVLAGKAKAIQYYLLAAYVGLALLRHIWDCVRPLFRAPKPIRYGILLVLGALVVCVVLVSWAH